MKKVILFMGLPGSIFSITAALVLPIAAGIWLATRKNGYLRPVLLGALTFFVFQAATRIPLMELWLTKTVWFTMFAVTRPILYALFLGATAALFEEGGRWLVMRLFMKNRRRLNDGVAFGIGHGGLEAVLLVGAGALASLIMDGPPATPWLTIVGGLERLFAMIIHVVLSVMVLKSIALKRPGWLLLAFVLHTVIDMGAILMHNAGISLIMLEATVGIFSVLMLFYVVIEHKKYGGGDLQ